MKQELVIGLKALIVLTLLTGVLYPLLLTIFAAVCFPKEAHGSLVLTDRGCAGSELLGQEFRSDRYFSSRPSASRHSTLPSSASNFGPTSAALRDSIALRRARFTAANGLASSAPVPDEMLTASASGVDPHISPAAARLQVRRVSRARGMDSSSVNALLERFVEPPQWGIFGESRVNVLLLNIALDTVKRK